MPWLTQAMLRSPTAPEPQRATAWCLAATGRGQLAKRHYRLAFGYGDVTVLAEARAMFPDGRALLEIVPDTPAGLAAAGWALADDPEHAAEAWTRAWQSFHDLRALQELARVKLALGDAEEGLRVSLELQREAPHNPLGYVFASRALEALDRGDEAQETLDLGAARLPGNPDVLTDLGLRQLTLRRYSQARASFEGIVARDASTLAYKHVLISRALESQSRFQEALREAQTARDISPSDSRAVIAFARCAAAIGRFDDAIEALEAASRLPGLPGSEIEKRIAELRERRAAHEHRRAAAGLR